MNSLVDRPLAGDQHERGAIKKSRITASALNRPRSGRSTSLTRDYLTREKFIRFQNQEEVFIVIKIAGGDLNTTQDPRCRNFTRDFNRHHAFVR